MVVYIFQGDYKNKNEELLRKALQMYAEAFDINIDDLPLQKTANGKPYLEGMPLHFSISHTRMLWGCLISSQEVGLDIQEKRNVNFSKLANRFFLEEEIKFVNDNGMDGFFDVWTRKEACIKYDGTGLRDLKSFCVVKNGELTEKIDKDGSVCFVSAFELDNTVKCAYCCSMEDSSLQIRELTAIGDG